jgi:hypothetical protein
MLCCEKRIVSKNAECPAFTKTPPLCYALVPKGWICFEDAMQKGLPTHQQQLGTWALSVLT